MSYKEPKKEGIKVSPFWIRAIASALAKQNKVTIEKGSKWAMDMKNKKLVYTDTLNYLDKDSVLALLLHEIGHLKYSSYPWIDESTAIYKDAPEAMRNCLNAIEDTRIDHIVSQEYQNSFSLIDTLHWQSAGQSIKTLKEYNQKMQDFPKLEAKYKQDYVINAQKVKAGVISQQAFDEWEDQAKPENKLDIKKLNPVAEIMFLFLTMYYGFESHLPKNYYNPKLVEKAKLVLEAQKKYVPEWFDNTREVQQYYEDVIYPIIKEEVPRNKDGSEKQPPMSSREALAKAQGGAGQEDFKRAQALLKDIEGKIEEEMIRSGAKPSHDQPTRDQVDYNQYYEEIKSMVNTSASKFMRVLKDNKFDRYVGSFRTGQLNSKRLFKYKANNFKMFQRKQERQNKDYAFSVLLDCSGSMEGSRIQESMKGVVLMSEVLNKSKVPFEVCFFSEGYKYGKSFNNHFSRVKMGTEATQVYGGGTSIAEPFKKSVASLDARREKHKIMITLTDGNVDGSDSEYIRKHVHKSTVMHYGIGIGVDLKDMFPNSINIEDVNTLVGEFGKILKKHIKIG